MEQDSFSKQSHEILGGVGWGGEVQEPEPQPPWTTGSAVLRDFSHIQPTSRITCKYLRWQLGCLDVNKFSATELKLRGFHLIFCEAMELVPRSEHWSVSDNISAGQRDPKFLLIHSTHHLVNVREGRFSKVIIWNRFTMEPVTSRIPGNTNSLEGIIAIWKSSYVKHISPCVIASSCLITPSMCKEWKLQNLHPEWFRLCCCNSYLSFKGVFCLFLLVFLHAGKSW